MSTRRYVAGCCLVIAAMAGIYVGIEYSGWVLFVGLWMVL